MPLFHPEYSKIEFCMVCAAQPLTHHRLLHKQQPGWARLANCIIQLDWRCAVKPELSKYAFGAIGCFHKSGS
jgi:hypothetical protein